MMPDSADHPATLAVPRVRMLDPAAQAQAIGPTLERRIGRVLQHGAFVMGPEVAELEEALAGRTGAPHVVTCANGTDALRLVLLAWGIGPGDAVLLPSFTFVATAEAVVSVGATPVFCDIRSSDFLLDPADVRRRLEQIAGQEKLRPRAIIPVDLFGRPAAYPALATLAEQHGLRILSDAAQSFGATLDGAPVGTLADATATSFFPAKPLGCFGDGGAILTDDAALADEVRSLRAHGRGRHKYDAVRIGINSRLDTIQAAVLLAKLTVFDAELEARRRIADRYSDAFASVRSIEAPARAPSAWAQYTIRVRGGHASPGLERDRLRRGLEAAGIPSAVYYPMPVHQQPAYCAYAPSPADLPNSVDCASSVLSLPLHPYLDDEDVESVIEGVLGAVGEGPSGVG